MKFDWDPKKAATNLRKHKVFFHEAATIFRDVLSVTMPDPDHSHDEERSITIELSNQRRLLIVAHTERGDRIRIISARELTRSEREANEEEKIDEMQDELRPEYDLRELLKSGVWGKYAKRYRAGTNLVLLAPDVAKVFSNDEEAVNEALRMVIRMTNITKGKKHRMAKAR
jgi:uncharacterized DUF497 family protein